MSSEESIKFEVFVANYNRRVCQGWKTYGEGIKQVMESVYINTKAILNNIKVNVYRCPR